MSKIVNGGKSETHIIKSYKFKELQDFDKNDEFVSFSSSKEEKIEESTQPTTKEEVKSEIIESLLQKIEELSNLVNQPQANTNCSEVEEKLKECYESLANEKEKAFKEGYESAIKELEEKYSGEIKALKSLFEDSLQKLSELNKIFEKKIEEVEKDLISIALDIAYQVIQKEVSDNSKEVAKALATSLMEELKDAKKVTIKVNPKDAEALKDIEGIEIIPDEAVKEGGIVINSEVGNIDAQIEERFKSIKEAILKNRSS